MAATLDKALDWIHEHGGLRTPGLAQLLGLSEVAVDALLEPACRSGALVTCDVQVNGRTVKEYRASTLLKDHTPFRLPGTPRADTESTAGQAGGAARAETEAQPEANQGGSKDTDPSATAPARPADHKEETMTSVRDQVEAVLRKHGPMDTRALRAHGVKDKNLAVICSNLRKRGVLLVLAGGRGKTVYGLPGQQLGDGGEPAGAPKVQRATRRRAGKKKRAAAKRKPREVRTPKKKFRPALAADGSLLFMGAKGGDFELDRAASRAVVGFIRRLEGDEIVATIEFIERLAAEEVAA